MTRFSKIIFSFLMITFLAACNQTIRSDVMRFHQLPKPSGEKIVIIPMNPEYNSSLEFATYAALVGNALGSYGYVPADGAEPDLIVELEFGVDEGQRTIRRSAGMYSPLFYGGYYGGFYRPWSPYRNPYYFGGGHYRSPLYYGGMYDPFGYYPLGYQSRVQEYVSYNRHLKMVIKSNQEGAQNLYEGEVKSRGRNNNLNEVMPYMVQAFFANFPGESGSSESVAIQLPKD
ncbi:MAG: DUF4136 domain-containing protein [Emcibacteraceae bacterium]|nr:DUF4136 domain-containing protein [Emcibacteraceae bacterium]MDG1858979.1 DUF4136 domain-containing protein [Emcibacteraceae bacterium]